MDQTDETQPFVQVEPPRKPKWQAVVTGLTALLAVCLCPFSLYYGIRAKDIDRLTFAFGETTYGTEYYWIFGLLLVAGALGVATFVMLTARKSHKFMLAQVIASILLAAVLSVVAMACIFMPHETRWGPLQIPYGDGTKIVWWTEQTEQTKLCVDGKLYYSNGYNENTLVLDDCDSVVDVIGTQFHQVLVDRNDFSYELFDLQHYADNTGRDEVKFLLVTDMHQNEKYMQKATQDAYNFDFVVSDGDMTTNSSLKQLYSLYRDFKPRSYVQALGNHELTSTRYNVFTRDSPNFHQQINGQHFFFINIFDSDGEPSEALMMEAANWLEDELDKYEGFKFVVSHYPIYSTGAFGSIPLFSNEIERILDSHYNSYVLGVFSGHSHVFNAFRRNYTQFIVAGNGGGEPDKVYDSSVMGDRVWKTQNLSGSLTPDENQKMGYEFHLNSWLRNTRTEIELTSRNITYTVRDLDTWKILASYQYEIDRLHSWGPIVTPLNDGANITWWTNGLTKTQVCVDNTLYYGTNNLKEMKTHEGCDYNPDVEGSQFHQLFINKPVFSAVIENRSIDFNNTPRAAHNFILTSDAHEGEPMIVKSIQDMENFDFHVSGGDTTYWQMSIEYQAGFLHWHQKPYAQAVGNHEGYTKLRQFGQREYNYYQNIQGINFYFIFVFNKSDIAAVSDRQVDTAMKWLESEIDLHEGPKFIVTHYPIYSTGEFGSYPLFTSKMEAFIDAHPSSKIVAVISGHEHMFAAFRRQDVMFLVAASNGGVLSAVQSTEVMGDRVWSSDSLHGALDGKGNEKNLGFEYHLDSWHRFTRTEVAMKEGLIKYTVRSLDDWTVLAEYETPYSE